MFTVRNSKGKAVARTSDLKRAVGVAERVRGYLEEVDTDDWCVTHNEATCRCPCSLIGPPPAIRQDRISLPGVGRSWHEWELFRG